MLTRIALLSLTLVSLFLGAAAQDPYIISGKIYDSVNNQSLNGASIRVKGSAAGTVAAADGSFHLKTTQKLPLTLIFSSIGYKAQEFTVSESGTKSINIS